MSILTGLLLDVALASSMNATLRGAGPGWEHREAWFFFEKIIGGTSGLRRAETCLSLSLMPYLSGAGTEGAVCPGSIGLSGHGIMAETPAVHNSAQKRFKRFKRHTANRRQKMIKTDLTTEVPSR